MRDYFFDAARDLHHAIEFKKDIREIGSLQRNFDRRLKRMEDCYEEGTPRIRHLHEFKANVFKKYPLAKRGLIYPPPKEGI